VAPGIEEFFYEPLLFDGTFFAVNRLALLMMLVSGLLCLAFGLGARKFAVVPRGWSNVVEVGLDFVRLQIVQDILGAKGSKYVPYLTALFFFILGCNITGILPGISLPTTSVIAIPLLLAFLTWLLFNIEGIRTHGLGGYLKNTLFPPGLPKPLYLLITPIEFISTFLLRPLTLTLRLLANMLAGHLILALFFTATTYLLFGFRDGAAYTAVFGVGALFAGVAFTFFEVLVAFLQAYIFTLLTAVYLAGALEAEH
jgi:F-type H+-transporting ATPase subunit a